jgi:diguanylate cyclase (GGDEF)-like protein
MALTATHNASTFFGVRQKMLLVLLGVLIVALTTTSWLTLQDYQRNVLRETDRRGADVASFLSQAVAFGVIGYDYHTIQMLLDKLVQSEDIVFARVMNRKGSTMAQAGTEVNRNESVMQFFDNIVFDGEVVGQVIVGFDNRRLISQLEAQRGRLVIREVGIVLLIALGEFLALSYIIMRPLNVISRSLREGYQEAGMVRVQQIPLQTRDEFGELAKQFNDIRAQLIEANERLQSKVEVADSKLRETNEQLMAQSEELRRMNEQLRRLSITDPLTGLYNRRQFEELMNTEILLSLRHGDANSLLAIDIDHFKRINDTFGHKAGDAVLRRLADLLVENVRRSDMVCRVGGEEFVVCLKRTPESQAMNVAEKLRKAIADANFYVDEDRIAVTISIGIASVPSATPAQRAEELFEQADKALYYSKEHGRNRVTHFGHILRRDDAQAVELASKGEPG